MKAILNVCAPKCYLAKFDCLVPYYSSTLNFSKVFHIFITLKHQISQRHFYIFKNFKTQDSWSNFPSWVSFSFEGQSTKDKTDTSVKKFLNWCSVSDGLYYHPISNCFCWPCLPSKARILCLDSL